MRRREYNRKRDGLGNRRIFQELRVTLLKKFLLLGGWVRKITCEASYIADTDVTDNKRMQGNSTPFPPPPPNLGEGLQYKKGGYLSFQGLKRSFGSS